MQNSNENILIGIEQNIRKLVTSYMVLGNFPIGWSNDAYDEHLSRRQITMRCILLLSERLNDERTGRLTIVEKLETIFPSISVNVYEPYVVCLCFDKKDENNASSEAISAVLQTMIGTGKIEVFEQGGISSLGQIVDVYRKLCSEAEEKSSFECQEGRVLRLYGMEAELLEIVIHYDREAVRAALEEIALYLDISNQHNWLRNQSYFCFLWRYIDRRIYQKFGRRTFPEKKKILDQKIMASADLEEAVDAIDEFIASVMEKLSMQAEEIAADNNHRILEMAKQYITENCSGDVSLDRVAREVGLSSFYLSKLFKKKAHINYKDFVVSVRMEKARKLITEGRMNVSEVAEAVGYNTNYFGKLFKNYFGITAKDMRIHQK